MTSRLTTLERMVLFVADDEGRIPLPKGGKDDVKTLRVTLARMKKMGFVSREENRDANCLPYALTKSGKTLRDEIIRGKFHL